MCDVFLVVCAEGIEGEASHPGKHTRVDADATGVFHHGDVVDMVIAVLDTPVTADGFACLASTEVEEA